MKSKKDKTEYFAFSHDESSETLFETVKGWEIPSQIKFAVGFDEPKRNELLDKIIEALKDETIKQKVILVKQRIDKSLFQIKGYTPSEIEHYQSLFANNFYLVLHSDNLNSYIMDEIRELNFYCKGLELDLRTKQYEFLEDKEQDKTDLTEAERYKTYLENLLMQFKASKPKKLKVKQIALIYVYEGRKPITRENADEIAAEHGYTAINSGEGLFQDYTFYSSLANRKGKPTNCNPKTLKNKIELFESVVSHLPVNATQRAIDEIAILKSIYEAEY